MVGRGEIRAAAAKTAGLSLYHVFARRQWALRSLTGAGGKNRIPPGEGGPAGKCAGKRGAYKTGSILIRECFLFWWGKVDSNHRRHCQQIYSLSPLATREFPHMKFWSWWTDLNPRPADYKSAALPAELHQHLTGLLMIADLVRFVNRFFAFFHFSRLPARVRLRGGWRRYRRACGVGRTAKMQKPKAGRAFGFFLSYSCARMILPLVVFGRLSRKTMMRGYL